MANAVVLDYGDDIEIATGQDLTTATNLTMFITKPDGTLATKVAADGVTKTATPTDGIIKYKPQTGFLDQDGKYLVSTRYEEPGDPGVFSQPTPNEYIVKRRNQTP